MFTLHTMCPGYSRLDFPSMVRKDAFDMHGWLDRAKGSVTRAVRWKSPLASVELVLELGAGARVRITEAGRLELAPRLLQVFSQATPC